MKVALSTIILTPKWITINRISKERRQRTDQNEKGKVQTIIYKALHIKLKD